MDKRSLYLQPLKTEEFSEINEGKVERLNKGSERL